MADRIVGRAFATRSVVLARHGMAATSQPLATGIAVDVLRRGGSAVDAAIAANAALCLMEPTGSGLGGDLFAIVWDAKEQRLHGLNASGRAPAGLTREAVVAQGHEVMPPRGPLPITVPGCADGWATLHARFGRRPLAELLAPAIEAAREGFPVSPVIAYEWGLGGARLRDHPGFAETFLPDGRGPASGELFRNPALADTLEAIGAEGRAGFYEGEVATRIEAACREAGGALRASDLAAHTSDWVEPVSATYRGFRVWELPPNGQGIAALQMLNVLEGFDLRSMGFQSTDHLHLMIEAKKLAYEDRARWYADPAFAEVPTERLISKEYAESRRALIDRTRAAETFEPGAAAALGVGDTVYLATADRDGGMVSLIQSNYMGFGSGITPPGTGLCLQNRGALFHLDAGHPNALAPGKRPFHTIIPAFVTREDAPFLCFGVMGGDMQPQAHVQVLSAIIDFGLDLQEAGDAARFHHTGSSRPQGGPPMKAGGEVALERGVEPAVRQELKERGHRIVLETGGFGGYQAIGRDAASGVWIGASESRKDGMAAGY